MSRLRPLILAGLCLALVLAIQAFRLPNPVTGIAVNAVFITAVHLVGGNGAMALGALTPVGAALTGHLDLPLLPLLPAIILGNMLFIALYAKLSGTARYLVPALIKALVIGAGGWGIARVVNLPVQYQPLLAMVLGIQFFTALFGILTGEQIVRRLPAGSLAKR